MTTLFEHDLGGHAGVHVLVIGVGAYTHLSDGSGKLAKKLLGLGQLSSPPQSAKALLDWFLAPSINAAATGFQNTAHPLSTVEALISAAEAVTIKTPTGDKAIETASKQNIQEAFDVWFDRVRACDTNIGVFYFCGHGVAVADHYLLADDFGKSTSVPWDNAFDISTTIRAVERELKGSLYFFIDACREVPKEMALTLGADPHALRALDLSKAVVRTSTSLIQATGETKLAFATEGNVSRFTQALLKALSGYCGVKGAGSTTWDVDGESLAPAVRRILEKENKTASRRQVSDQAINGVPVPLVRLSTIPQVMVELDLTPEAMRKLSQLYLRSMKGVQHVHLGANGPFSAVVPRGMYCVGASPLAAQFPQVSFDDQDLTPPCYELTLSV